MQGIDGSGSFGNEKMETTSRKKNEMKKENCSKK
jgi:hypothetical protein